MWYYNLNNQPTGPLDDAAVQSLVKAGVITPATLVWQEGMPNWVTMGSTTLATLVPTATPAPIPPAPVTPPAPMVYPANAVGYAPAPMPAAYGVPYKPAAVQIKEMNDLFQWFWICLILMVVTFGANAIASLVLFFIIIHRSWALIQDGYARTTPGKAIGYLFIPFYSFYWIFPAFSGLSKDMNMFMARRNLPIQRSNEGLATAFSIFWLLNAIPYVDFVTVIPWFILWIIYTKDIKDTAISIIQYTQK